MLQSLRHKTAEQWRAKNQRGTDRTSSCGRAELEYGSAVHCLLSPVAYLDFTNQKLLRVTSCPLLQVKKVVGFTAPPEFISKVQALAAAHSRLLRVDCIRAYHFGVRRSALDAAPLILTERRSVRRATLGRSPRFRRHEERAQSTGRLQRRSKLGVKGKWTVPL